MAKLNPPVIEGTIPAFYGSVIEVPYAMNKTVGKNQIAGFSLKIKTVQSNYYLGEVSCSGTEALFVLPDSITQHLNIGQYYKIQIAYIEANTKEIGFYSTVATVKYTTQPSISIIDSTDGFTYTGLYSQEAGDTTEKVYSYQFDLKDNKGQIVETSGECLHNNSFDTENYQSTDSFTITYDLEPNITYYLTYKVKTINGLEEASGAKRLYKTDSIDSKLNTVLTASLNYEDGYVNISLTKPDDVEVEEAAVGTFILLRADSETNFKVWNEVFKFVLYGQRPSRQLWKDMTVKQGVSYKYAIQQYNSYNLRSNKIESEIVDVDFEYAYLFDGERQLKIKYNPKVSSFKNTVLESKVDTIGSKYPFIFRNGNVKYKEFPVSGLISLLSDENSLFYEIEYEKLLEHRPKDNLHGFLEVVKDVPLTENEYLKNYFSYYIQQYYSIYRQEEQDDGTYKKVEVKKVYYYITLLEYLKECGIEPKYYFVWDSIHSILSRAFYKKILFVNKRSQEYAAQDFSNQRTTNLISSNIYNERNFKLEVLEWLTNGEPKLFRSPTEGNYLVRLLNVSLSPNDTLGRMLHTFSATAYEIGDCSYETLTEWNIIQTDSDTPSQLRGESIDLSSATIIKGQNLLEHEASSVRLEGLIPGDKIQFTIDGKSHEVVIGVTGSYLIDLQNDVAITSLSFIGGSSEAAHQGMLTYTYYTSDFRDSFDTINTLTIQPVPARQFLSTDKEIMSQLIDRKTEIQSIGNITLTLRDDGDLDLYYQTSEEVEPYYSTDSKGQNIFELVPHSSLSIYKVYSFDDKGEKVLDHYLDGYSLEQLTVESMDGHDCTSAWINGEQIDLYDIYSYTLRTPPDIKTLKIGKAVVCNLSYQSKIISYDVENTSSKVITARKNYDTALTLLNTLITSRSATITEIVAQEEVCKELYDEFIAQVDAAIIESERR